MDWTVQDLGAIGEFIGAIAVVVTLIYLALQVRQNTEQARLSSIQAVNASNDSAFEPIYIPENTRIWTTGLANRGALDDGERLVFDMLMTRLIASFDTTTYQFDHGAYDPELYQGMPGFFASFVSTPGGLEWYKASRDVFSAKAQSRLDEAISNDASDSS